MRSQLDVRVVVIGGGGTGAAVAYDLSRRGAAVTLVERGELTSGTTGRHHGQLHSGARYAVGDAEIARECMQEVDILRRIAPESIEMNMGLFVALNDDDVDYLPTFTDGLRSAGIPHRVLDPEEARRHEPAISKNTRSAVLVPDGTLDAYRLPLSFFAGARDRGAVIRNFCRLESIESSGGSVSEVVVTDLVSGTVERISCDVAINACGPWAGLVAARAGVALPITPAPGTMVAVRGRLCNMVVSHLHPPGDGDIVVPQRRLSIVGSTQWRTDDPDDIHTPPEDVEYLLRRGGELVEGFSEAEFHAAWTAARPLAGSAGTGPDAADDGADADDDDAGRGLSRDFECRSHAPDGAAGFYSVIGGKATVLRAMAEETVDTVFADLSIDVPCTTAEEPLPAHYEFFAPLGRQGRGLDHGSFGGVPGGGEE